jgi:hypothetical protein
MSKANLLLVRRAVMLEGRRIREWEEAGFLFRSAVSKWANSPYRNHLDSYYPPDWQNPARFSITTSARFIQRDSGIS